VRDTLRAAGTVSTDEVNTRPRCSTRSQAPAGRPVSAATDDPRRADGNRLGDEWVSVPGHAFLSIGGVRTRCGHSGREAAEERAPGADLVAIEHGYVVVPCARSMARMVKHGLRPQPDVSDPSDGCGMQSLRSMAPATVAGPVERTMAGRTGDGGVVTARRPKRCGHSAEIRLHRC
jgi:hypothetical protein